MYGADADQLDAVAGDVSSAGARLASSRSAIGRRISSAPWQGRSAEAFRARWVAEYGRSMSSAVQFLEEIADELRRHAAEQRAASGASGGTIASDGGTTRRDGDAARRRKIERLRELITLESETWSVDVGGQVKTPWVVDVVGGAGVEATYSTNGDKHVVEIRVDGSVGAGLSALIASGELGAGGAGILRYEFDTREEATKFLEDLEKQITPEEPGLSWEFALDLARAGSPALNVALLGKFLYDRRKHLDEVAVEDSIYGKGSARLGGNHVELAGTVGRERTFDPSTHRLASTTYFLRFEGEGQAVLNLPVNCDGSANPGFLIGQGAAFNANGSVTGSLVTGPNGSPETLRLEMDGRLESGRSHVSLGGAGASPNGAGGGANIYGASTDGWFGRAVVEVDLTDPRMSELAGELFRLGGPGAPGTAQVLGEMAKQSEVAVVVGDSVTHRGGASVDAAGPVKGGGVAVDAQHTAASANVVINKPKGSSQFDVYTAEQLR